MDSKHDSAFLNILSEEKNVTSFLDRLFGFLYRCTDFYIETNPGQRLGFPKGVAEELVFYTFRKWKNMKILTEQSTQVDSAVQVREPFENLARLDGFHSQSTSSSDIVSIKSLAMNTPVSSKPGRTSEKGSANSSTSSISKRSSTPDTYNGGSFENYRWSQTINDLDVIVNVPSSISNCKQLRVFLNSDMLEVSIIQPVGCNRKLNEWKIIVKGELSHRIKISESFWCLEPGKHVNLHLQKTEERWWVSLLEKEPQIQMSKLDCTKNFEDMSEREQMKVQELMWNQQCKLQAQKSSSSQLRAQTSRVDCTKNFDFAREVEQARPQSTILSRPSILKTRSMSKSPPRSIQKSRSSSSHNRVVTLMEEHP